MIAENTLSERRTGRTTLICLRGIIKLIETKDTVTLADHEVTRRDILYDTDYQVFLNRFKEIAKCINPVFMDGYTVIKINNQSFMIQPK